MANTLLDTIRKNSQSLLQPPGVTDETQKAQSLLAARSGKAVTGGGDYATSNLGEQSAVASTANQLKNVVAPQAQLQQEGLEQQAAGEEQQTNQQKQSINQSRTANDLQTKLQTNQLLNDMARQKGQIDLEKNRAQVDQVAQNLRLQTQSYTQNLQLEGNKNRLNNDLDFKQALEKSILGDKQDLLQKQLGNRSVLDISTREFSRAMSNMNVDFAYDLFEKELAADRQRQVYSGAGSLATAGVGVYGKLPTTPEPGPPTTSYVDYNKPAPGKAIS